MIHTISIYLTIHELVNTHLQNDIFFTPFNIYQTILVNMILATLNRASSIVNAVIFVHVYLKNFASRI